jgi:murein DD-endopeptidase MepM/ murein hydrolase activator NlpD
MSSVGVLGTTTAAMSRSPEMGDVMSDDRVRRQAFTGPGHRGLSLMSALAFAVLLVLSACTVPGGSQASFDTVARDGTTSATESSSAEVEGTGTGWKVFLAATHQWQMQFSLMQVGPPWAAAIPLVSHLRPGADAPVYKGKLPVNTLIAPARPTDVHPAGAFGNRVAPDLGVPELHNGADLAAERGSPVVAAMDGVVRAVFWDVWGGNRVEVAHVNGMKTTYNHLDEVSVQKRDVLQASQRLGSVGASGARVTGPHLHFETWIDDKAVDPQAFDWIDGDRVIKAPRESGQNVPKIESGGPGDQSSLGKVTDCPHAKGGHIDCGAPDAVEREERCATGDTDSDCPGALTSQRAKCVVVDGEVANCKPGKNNDQGPLTSECPEGGLGTPECPTPEPVQCPEGGLGTPECPTPEPVQCPEGGLGTPECPTPEPVQCPEGGLGTPECPTPESPVCPSATPGPVDCEPPGPGPEDCPPTVPGQVDCYPSGPGLEDCAVRGPGALDCTPAGVGPEDCPAAEDGRADCPAALSSSEGVSSSKGGGTAVRLVGVPGLAPEPVHWGVMLQLHKVLA